MAGILWHVSENVDIIVGTVNASGIIILWNGLCTCGIYY